MGAAGRRDRRGWASLLTRLILVGGLLVAAAAPADAARSAALVVDFDSGRILHMEDPDVAVYPASLTKTMTLYMVFEALRTKRVGMATAMKVSSRAAAMPPSRLGLKAGSAITVKDAILALITKSANDVAVVVAEHLAGSEVAFARAMTEKAQRLGMSRTQFRNASGLPHGDQRTTARDMTQLGIRMIRDFPEYYHLFGTKEFRFRGRAYRNHNGLLYRYAGADGMKTGYIRASGFNLLASAVRGERRLVAAVFGGRSARARDDRMVELLDKGFRTGTGGPAVAAGRIGDRPAGPDRRETLAALPQARPATERGQGDLGTVVAALEPTGPAAAPGTAVPAARPGTTGRHAIQVGAFRNAAQAEKAAAGAARHAPGLLAGLDPRIAPVKARRGQLYRAWLVGLSEADARRACQTLRKAGQDCLVVRP
jgi:D-alanyl-D-alanine carboxypeptidase